MLQAAVRAGRRDDRGRVFLQTYQPQHYAVQYAAKQDYEGFYEEEMLMRQMMGYPPFSAFFSILLTGAAQEEAAQAAQELAKRRLEQAEEDDAYAKTSYYADLQRAKLYADTDKRMK